MKLKLNKFRLGDVIATIKGSDIYAICEMRMAVAKYVTYKHALIPA